MALLMSDGFGAASPGDGTPEEKDLAEERKKLLGSLFDQLTDFLLENCPEDQNWEAFDPDLDGLRCTVSDLLEDMS